MCPNFQISTFQIPSRPYFSLHDRHKSAWSEQIRAICVNFRSPLIRNELIKKSKATAYLLHVLQMFRFRRLKASQKHIFHFMRG